MAYGSIIFGFILGCNVLTSATHGFLLQTTANATNFTSTANPNISTTAIPTNATNTTSTASPFKTATPLPKSGHFSLSKNGTKCLLLDLNCDVTVKYGSHAKIESITYHVPSNAQASGTCVSSSSSVSTVTLSWSVSNTSFHLTMGFKQGKKWAMNLLAFTADGHGTPLVSNGTDVITASINESSVEGKQGYSYLCEKKKTITLDKGTVIVTLNSIHVQPFSGDFGKSSNCNSSVNPAVVDSDNVVPLAVGCTLAALVIILIIAYCVGRGRGGGYDRM